jgi:hypothetical protein
MMRGNEFVRREAHEFGHTIDPSRETFVFAFADLSAEAEGEGRRSNRPGNSQAKGPRRR